VGFTAKGKAKEFIGVGIDQTTPGRIVLDMRATANNIVKKHGFEDAHHAHAPSTSGTVLSEIDCAKEGGPTAPDRTANRSRIGSLLWMCRVSWRFANHWLPCRFPVSHEPRAWQEALAGVL
jgi:hypothetical protein